MTSVKAFRVRVGFIVRNNAYEQCDQIGLFEKVISDTFSGQ